MKISADSHINAEGSLTYWNSISPDVNGMLGGYPQISRIDLQGSKNFINKISRLNPRLTQSDSDGLPNEQSSTSKKLRLAVDCGAGIGRVTLGCLSHLCDVVDIVEPVAKFANVLAGGPLKEDGKIGDIFITSLQLWTPPSSKQYDLIWNQWCLGHLTDAQLVSYLQNVSGSLAEGGWIGVKENMNTRSDHSDTFDELDSSVTRSHENFKSLFEHANLKIIKTELQTGYPQGLGLYPVRMYALKPVSKA